MAARPLFGPLDYALRHAAARLPTRQGYALTRSGTLRLGGLRRRWIAAEVSRRAATYLGEGTLAKKAGERFVAELACDDLDALTASRWTPEARLAATSTRGIEQLPERGPAILASFHFSGGFRIFDVLCARGLRPTFLHAPPRASQGYQRRMEQIRQNFLATALEPSWIEPGPGARDALARHLDGGGVVVALLDVAPGALELRDRAPGVLLGRHVELPVGLLRLGLDQGAPVIPYDGWLDEDRRVLEFHTRAAGSSPGELLQSVLDTCEKVIRARPWTWQAWLDTDGLWTPESKP